MATPIKNYKRGTLPYQLEFDPAQPFSTSGGNGDLYRAILHLTSHPDGSPFQYSYVALKRMRWGTDDEDNRLHHVLEEAYVWKRVHHPNVLRFLGILSEDEDVYLVSPFAPHGSLPQYIAAHPHADRRMFLWQIAAGIAYLHSENIVHGDIKGANILVFDGPTAKICDFGLSKVPDGRQTTNPQYSLPWTSPERLLGEPRSNASDVYAFGMTIYEILSGQIPFRTLDNFVELVAAICINELRPPMEPKSCCAGLSYSTLWMIAQQCWQKARDKRPSMKEVLDSITPSEVVTVIKDDLDDQNLFSMAPSSDATSRRRKRMNSTGEPIGTVWLRELRGSLTKGSPAADLTQTAGMSKVAKRLKLQHCEADGDLDQTPTNYQSLSSRVATPPETFPKVDSILRAVSASHRAARPNAPTVCLEGTRTAVLEKVYEWAWSVDPNTPRVFWLNGMAGTGKSTIAQTLAEKAEDKGILGASFFFSRHGDTEVRNARLVIPTIAFQLASAFHSFKSRLAKELEQDLDAVHAVRHRQVKTLLSAPLQSIQRSAPIILVIDALDECEGRDAAELLQLLLAMISQPATPPALKLFITCRPDRDLNLVFQRAQVHQRFLLHDVELDIVQADIERYLRNGLTNPPPDQLPPDWISTTDLKELVLRAGKLFVYATTTLKYICDTRFDPPRNRLQSILAASHGTGENPLADLDDLYLQVLRAAIGPPSRQNSEAMINRAAGRIRWVLGALVLVLGQLPLITLAELLGMEKDQIKATLEHLQSVIVTPESDEETPQFLHQSFPDFIISPDRCEDRLFLIDVAEHERQLALRCMNVMATLLKRNIAGSEAEIAIAQVLKYACCHWASHLVRSPPGDKDLLMQLEDFANRCLLWWLEVLSGAGQVAIAARAAEDAFKWAVLSKASEITTSLLHDVHRLVLAHLTCISEAPRHVYYSALPFVPRSTSLWKLYRHEAALSVQVLSGVEEDWLQCLSVLANHEHELKIVVLSPDGTRIVSGSEDDTVRIWDAVSGCCTAVLEGHSGAVTTVALSLDGTRVVSGSEDHTVRIWDALSGQCTAVLEGHSNAVTNVAFSRDDTLIVSGSWDRTVRIWDAVSGQCIAKLEGHSGAVTTVAVSLDGTRVVSGSEDDTVRIWDTISGQCIAALKGHSGAVTTIVLSPDGTRVVSGSEDETVRIWDAVSGQRTATLKGHSSGVTTIAFSLDGTRIVSGSRDDTVRIWDATSGQCIATLEGHSDAVYTIVISPDGTRIVSGSEDDTVRIWDAVSGQCTATLKGHSSGVITIALSSDGTRIVSGSRDRTVRIWDAVSGRCTATPEGNFNWASTVALSLDGSQIVSGSEDDTVRIWDAVSGRCTTTLKGHSGAVTTIALSPDGTRIVSGSEDNTVRIWDAVSGQRTATLKGHAGGVTTVALSPDGTRIVSGSRDGMVRIWDAVSGKCVAILHCDEVHANTLAFSHDGTRILLRLFDGNIRAWDFITTPSNVVIPYLSDANVLPGESLIFGDKEEEDGEDEDENYLVSMRSEWSTFVDVPAFIICGLQVWDAKIFPDRRLASVQCGNSRGFLFYHPLRAF